MKSKLLSATLLAALSLPSQAELLGLEAGIANWNHEPSGGFAYDDGTGATTADLEDDLNLSDEKENYIYAVIRHAVPLIPNVKVATTALSSKGSGSVSTDFTFGGQTYTAGTDVNTELTLDHTDVTVFWNLLETGLTFDLGLTARQIDGKASVDDGAGNYETADIDGTVPMLYANLAVSPMDNLRFSFEANYIGAGESAFTDTIAKVSYYTDFMLGVEAGVRSMTLELDDLDGSSSDMEFSGSFVGLAFKF